MAADGQGADGRRSRFQPLGLLTATLVIALILAIFFVSFLILPLAILVVFYVGFAASDRARRLHHDPVAPSASQAAPDPSARPQRPADDRDDEQGAA
jgi:hypothetical protein